MVDRMRKSIWEQYILTKNIPHSKHVASFNDGGVITHDHINGQGYRSDEFDETEGIKIVFVGCSYTFGIGLYYDETWPKLLCNRLEDEYNTKFVNWNLALPGQSNDYMARMLNVSIPMLQPNLVVILFTGLARREFLTEDGRHISITPTSSGGIDKMVKLCFKQLSSQYQNLLNFYNNYISIKNLLAYYKIPWVFSQAWGKDIYRIRNLLPYGQFLGVNITISDYARDKKHPGQMSNFRFSNTLFKFLKDNAECWIK